MTGLDELWTLEWAHEENAQLEASAIDLYFGRLRQLRAMYCDIYAWEYTTDDALDHVGLNIGLLRKIDDGLTRLAFARHSSDGLVDVVRFEGHFAGLLTGHRDFELEETHESLLVKKQALLAAGVIQWDGFGWDVDLWYPELRKQNLVTYERRGRSLRQELEGFIATGWGKLIADTLKRPILKVDQEGDRLWHATLDDARVAERILGRSLGIVDDKLHHAVRVHEVCSGSLEKPSFSCPNPNVFGRCLELLLDRQTGTHVLLDLLALVDYSKKSVRSKSVASGRQYEPRPFKTEGARWTPLLNADRGHVNGTLSLDLSILRRTVPEMILSEGVLPRG